MKPSHTFKLLILGILSASSGLLGLVLENQNAVPPKLTNQINNMTDQLMDASKSLAVERGLVNGLINNPFVKKKGQVETIKAMREESSAAFTKLDKSLKIIKDQEMVAASEERVLAMRSTLEKVIQLRVKADSVISAGWDDPALKATWFPSVSKLILATNAVTEDIISGTKNKMDGKTQIAIEVKHALWEAAEYAGVERGALNAKISASSIITQDDYKVLKMAADKINNSWLIVLDHKGDFGSGFEGNIKQIQQIYFVKFNEMRNDVLSAGMAKVKYPVSSEQWFDAATDGIQLMNAAHKSITEFTSQRLQSTSATSQFSSRLYYGLLLLGFIISCGSLWSVYKVGSRP